ncbi:WhiB family transcriptional regulator [Trueperella pyogenes]|uniref:WhiB family transcriptional regulator n=1 Tax=Trueperella pyogenes TaxID=1661 RepID=UPI00345D385F
MIHAPRFMAERFHGAPCTCLTLEEAERIFFPTRKKTLAAAQARAKEICDSCPVKDECLSTTMWAEGDARASNRYGIYAGLTPTERYQLAKNTEW